MVSVMPGPPILARHSDKALISQTLADYQRKPLHAIGTYVCTNCTITIFFFSFLVSFRYCILEEQADYVNYIETGSKTVDWSCTN